MERVSDNPSTIEARRRGRRSMVLVALLFIVPLLVSAWLYASGWRPGGTVNQGELIIPPVDVSMVELMPLDGGPARRFGGQWSLVHALDATCGAGCLERLYDTRQVRFAIGRDIDRVQRFALLASPTGSLSGAEREQHPDLILLRAPPGDEFPADGSVRIVDPLGNLMMRYAPGQPAEDILKDLKRLLKLSTVG
jgi:hypothetical protein